MTITSLNVVDGTVGKSRMSAVKKKWIVIGIAAAVVVVLVILLATGIIPTKTNDSESVLHPPNPIVKLPPSVSKLHVFKSAAVCADTQECAQIGRDILTKNGSAVDSAIAALICNGMVAMQSMGLGGGFLMTIFDKSENKVHVLNSRELAPSNSHPDDYKGASSQFGPLAIGVPAELRGYWAAHQRFGKLTWKDLVEPSAELCEKGYKMTAHQHHSVANNKLAQSDPNIREWLFDGNGKLKPIGSIISPKKLCRTFRTIAETDGNALHNGSLSKDFLRDLQNAGSKITEKDLADYQPEWQDPVKVELNNGDTLYSVPPPGSGLLLAFIVKILDGYNFTTGNIEGVENTVTTYHRFIEAFKFAFAKRTELGDMNFVNITELVRNLTSAEYAEGIRSGIKDNLTSDDPAYYGAVYSSQSDHGTSHMSIIDASGDAVSVTTSLNIYFGCGIVSNSTGILFNSVMDDFAIPTAKNYFFLPPSPNNALVPGKRPMSSMTPSILVGKDGNVKIAIGASGGTRIPSGMAQVLGRHLWFGQTLKEAVDAPRFHNQVSPAETAYDYGFLQSEIDGLTKIGHRMKRNDFFKSVVCALLKVGDSIFGNADYRKAGDVYGL